MPSPPMRRLLRAIVRADGHPDAYLSPGLHKVAAMLASR